MASTHVEVKAMIVEAFGPFLCVFCRRTGGAGESKVRVTADEGGTVSEAHVQCVQSVAEAVPPKT